MKTANIKSEAILKVIAQYLDGYDLNGVVIEYENSPEYIRIELDGYKKTKGESK